MIGEKKQQDFRRWGGGKEKKLERPQMIEGQNPPGGGLVWAWFVVPGF